MDTMDGGNVNTMDGGDEFYDSSASISYELMPPELEEKIRELIKDKALAINSSPNAKIMINDQIRDFLQYDSVWLATLSWSIQDLFQRHGFLKSGQLEPELKSILERELTPKIMQIQMDFQVKLDAILAKVEPVLKMLEDPNLALSARVKSFAL